MRVRVALSTRQQLTIFLALFPSTRGLSFHLDVEELFYLFSVKLATNTAFMVTGFRVRRAELLVADLDLVFQKGTSKDKCVNLSRGVRRQSPASSLVITECEAKGHQHTAVARVRRRRRRLLLLVLVTRGS